MIRLPRLSVDPTAFPAIETALEEPDGLLAFGGDLGSERLLAAYAQGIFPWYSEGQPILWWSPDPRMVIATAAVHVPRRLRRWLKSCNWTIRTDHAFAEVMRACAEPRHDGGGTWITEAMLAAYTRLHAEGHAHSLEVHDGAALIGGIYGIAIGRMFFGESMFSRREHASKVALLALCHGLATQGFPLLDAQVRSAHLETLGARAMPRTDFLCAITRLCSQTGIPGNWAGLFDHLRPQDLCRPIP
ncbi:MAG TPA: leucyl/phenylalanyl-tRNA--protein transferase [Dokdonella sp.]|uniref:leucyl/phenylalanyl-tRNA--protein transferase n=1 Tax=Dokdonella sp. TaxID=2291710 RepID=UPI002BB99286|nr:leucyl/phenylalanyl-tRNA--protein transferase [Xanthomonadales bacterium]HQW75641.1 leucyl/phenylalanyl-tRNA--protein transferase [Dokdonella sp.]MBK7211068.1 leucyl/phenylalanyl-tRNA--protein transferase [Xanthomonadales bacterium]HQX64180.1 leucyl/phenylalanyl-tRNA--protein transferase [Dokdonella sp.]HQY53913.1 leucyl/phenylalanyl-tRNA--protein transferase [Dokdonella sp.]